MGQEEERVFGAEASPLPKVSPKTAIQCFREFLAQPTDFTQRSRQRLEENKPFWNYLNEGAEVFSSPREREEFWQGAAFVGETLSRELGGNLPNVSEDTIQSLKSEMEAFASVLVREQQRFWRTLISTSEIESEAFIRAWEVAGKESGFMMETKIRENSFLYEAVSLLRGKTSACLMIGAIVAYEPLRRQVEADKLAAKFGL